MNRDSREELADQRAVLGTVDADPVVMLRRLLNALQSSESPHSLDESGWSPSGWSESVGGDPTSRQTQPLPAWAKAKPAANDTPELPRAA